MMAVATVASLMHCSHIHAVQKSSNTGAVRVKIVTLVLCPDAPPTRVRLWVERLAGTGSAQAG